MIDFTVDVVTRMVENTCTTDRPVSPKILGKVQKSVKTAMRDETRKAWREKPKKLVL